MKIKHALKAGKLKHTIMQEGGMRAMEKQGLFYRSFEIDVKSIDEKKRSIDVSFSSEKPAYPYSWSDVPEILLHGEENVDLTYLKTTGSVLMNHQPHGPGQPVVIVGKPDNIRIENRRGMATIFFDEDEESDKAFKKVVSGSLRGISVGAQVSRRTELRADDEMEGISGPAVLATKWMPVEISLTPIPVDASVGVNRSLSEIDIQTKPLTEGNTMKPEEVQAMIDKSVGKIEIPKAEDIATAVRSILTEDAKPKMKIDNEVFIDLLGRAGAVSPECKSKITDMATEGKTEGELLRAITDMATEPPDTDDRGDLTGGTGLKKDTKNVQRVAITSFEGVKDEDFFAGIAQPSLAF